MSHYLEVLPAGDNVSKLTRESVIEMSTEDAGGLVSRWQGN
jgi:hypothetical protein